MFFYDATYIIVFPALLLAFYAQFKVKSTFNRYLRERAYVGLTGAQVARRMLDDHGLHNVAVETTGGYLGDHYDPGHKAVRLSPQVYNGTSLAAVGVCCPRGGPCSTACSQLYALGPQNQPLSGSQHRFPDGLPLFLWVFSFAWDTLMLVGIWFFIAALAFQLITLPVEFNASRRAMAYLTDAGYLNRAEAPKVEIGAECGSLDPMWRQLRLQLPS